MELGAAVPISSEDETGLLIITIAGRGVMVLDGDRVEVSANDLVHIPAGVPYGLRTLGGTDWGYVGLQAPAGLDFRSTYRALIRPELQYLRVRFRHRRQAPICPFYRPVAVPR